MTDRQAKAIATAISETSTVTPELARLQGIALAGVFQILITEAGRRTRQSQSQDQIADELRPAIEGILDDLDQWLTPSARRHMPKLQAGNQAKPAGSVTRPSGGRRRRIS
jgi:hypothetical protein